MILSPHKKTRRAQVKHATPQESKLWSRLKNQALGHRLLLTLIRHAGKVMTHRQLLQAVWGPNHTESGHYLRIYMGHLRQKLEVTPAQPKHFLTETGVGYRFVL